MFIFFFEFNEVKKWCHTFKQIKRKLKKKLNLIKPTKKTQATKATINEQVKVSKKKK